MLYKDSVIEVRLLAKKDNEALKYLALKYIEPVNYKDKNGKEIVVTNVMGGETDWFILPYTFGVVIGRMLFEQYSAGLLGFNKTGVEVLKEWLIEIEAINDAICY